MTPQRTIRSCISARGVGVHTGEMVTIRLCPAPVDTGIIFRRIDCDPVVNIPAQVECVGDTRLSTCLVKDGHRISTVEHLMSAIAGLGIDNLYIDIDSSELPIMDGSAAPFVFLLQSAGLAAQTESVKKFVRIKKKVTVEQDDKVATVEPYDGFRVYFEIDFKHPEFNVNNQRACIDFSSTSFVKEVCRARTFGFMSDFEMLRANNLALGGSLNNAVVMDEEKVMNEQGLRYEDECVRHKILDAIGDLYLLGHSLIGAFSGRKSGHTLNNLLLKKLLADKDAWEIVSFDDSADMPIRYIPLVSIEMPEAVA